MLHHRGAEHFRSNLDWIDIIQHDRSVVAAQFQSKPLQRADHAAHYLLAGVVNVITDVNDLGHALSSHADVAKVTFTGSTATGKKVMASVASTIKRLTLELGGNDAAIVLDDVDPDEVAAKVFAAAMMNSGQICLGAKRIYVHDLQYDQVCDELGRLARELVVDDGLKQGTQMGPLQNKAQFEKVKGFLEDARRNGKIVAGGEVLNRKGYFDPANDRPGYPGRCAVGDGGTVWSDRSGAALF